VLFHITEDHTVARLKVEAGEMTEAEAASSRYRHVLTRVLDGRPEHVPDVTARPARTGDRYLLCTSALATVDAQSIHHDLTTIEDPQAAATALVAQAGDAHDVTCVVVDVLERFPDLNGGAGGLSPAGRPRIG
jgi:protein phosphatase